MAKKTKTFAEKVAAASELGGRQCPTCGEMYQNVQQVMSVKQKETNSWKFNQRMVAVCKCNRAEVLG